MTVQMNARVSDETGAKLDRYASKRGIERAALVRDMLDEGVAALDEGRASFERPEVPGPTDFRHMAAKVSELTTELERVLRQNAKRDAELLKSARDDTLGVSEARGAIAADVAARTRSALELIHGQLVELGEALMSVLADQPQLVAIDAKLDGMKADTDAKLAEITALAKRPRDLHRYDFGFGQWTGGAFAGAFAILMALSVGVFFVLAAVLPDRALAVPTGNRLLGGGDEAICTLVDRRYGTERCKVVFGGKTVTVTARRPGTGMGRGR